MLNVRRLNELMTEQGLKLEDVSSSLTSGHGKKSSAVAKNWARGLMKPAPKKADVEAIAETLGVDAAQLKVWTAKQKYAPQSARKVRLVADLIRGRHVQDALDILKFTSKRSALYVGQVLKSAIANADEAEADVDALYVIEARVDGAGRRLGTKGFIPKDRGRAHPIRKEASHIYVTVAQIVEE